MGRRRDTTAWAAVERKVAEEQDSPAARSPAARSLAAAHTSAAAVDTWAAAARWRQCLRDCCVPPGVLPAAVLLLLSLSMVPPSTAPGGGRGGGGGGGKRREERRRDLLRVHGLLRSHGRSLLRCLRQRHTAARVRHHRARHDGPGGARAAGQDASAASHASAPSAARISVSAPHTSVRRPHALPLRPRLRAVWSWTKRTWGGKARHAQASDGEGTARVACRLLRMQAAFASFGQASFGHLLPCSHSGWPGRGQGTGDHVGAVGRGLLRHLGIRLLILLRRLRARLSLTPRTTASQLTPHSACLVSRPAVCSSLHQQAMHAGAGRIGTARAARHSPLPSRHQCTPLASTPPRQSQGMTPVCIAASCARPRLHYRLLTLCPGAY